MLRLLAETPPRELAETLVFRFPNPVYRRKLLWGIRQKASAGAEDWELYSRAARRESRVVRPGPLSSGETVPVVTEPFAALLKFLSRDSPPSGRRRGPRTRAGSR